MPINEIPAVSVTYARTGGSTRSNAPGMRAMQERAYEKRGVLYTRMTPKVLT